MESPFGRNGIRIAAVVSGAAIPDVWVLLPMGLKDPVFDWIAGSVGRVILALLVIPALLSGVIALLHSGPDRYGKWRAARVFFINFNVAQGVVWLALILSIVFNPVVPH